jgi:pSer/pThr/pTyr-binding forkhead associated (FHA) protein
MPTLDLTLYRGKEFGVSRVHAELYFEDNHAFLLELGSSNGTQVNGRRVQVGIPRQIRDGDEIALSKLLIRVYFE